MSIYATRLDAQFTVGSVASASDRLEKRLILEGEALTGFTGEAMVDVLPKRHFYAAGEFVGAFSLADDPGIATDYWPYWIALSGDPRLQVTPLEDRPATLVTQIQTLGLNPLESDQRYVSWDLDGDTPILHGDQEVPPYQYVSLLVRSVNAKNQPVPRVPFHWQLVAPMRFISLRTGF